MLMVPKVERAADLDDLGGFKLIALCRASKPMTSLPIWLASNI